MLSLADVLKVIDNNESVEVFDIHKNVSYYPRYSDLPKEWIDYTVKYIHSATDIYNDSFIIIGVEEVYNA